MSDGDDVRLVADVDSNLKRRAKADPRSIKEIVEASLRREFQTGESAAVERRIEEKENRIQTLDREINERKRERAKEREELNRLEAIIDDFEGRKYDRLNEAQEKLEGVELVPSNPGVQKQAEKIGMTAHELIAELNEMDGEHST